MPYLRSNNTTSCVTGSETKFVYSKRFSSMCKVFICCKYNQRRKIGFNRSKIWNLTEFGQGGQLLNILHMLPFPCLDVCLLRGNICMYSDDWTHWLQYKGNHLDIQTDYHYRVLEAAGWGEGRVFFGLATSRGGRGGIHIYPAGNCNKVTLAFRIPSSKRKSNGVVKEAAGAWVGWSGE